MHLRRPASRMLISANPSTMNESEFVDLIRAALISFWAVVLEKACAFSMLSNFSTTNRSGGDPSRLVNFVLRMTDSPPAALGLPA